MLKGTCHCGAVTVTLPRAPETLTNCNCSICRRYGALWAYYSESEVGIAAPRGRGAPQAYAWGEHRLDFMRCGHCGCVTHWRLGAEARAELPAGKAARVGVNARLFDPLMLGSVKIRRLDGADTWAEFD